MSLSELIGHSSDLISACYQSLTLQLILRAPVLGSCGYLAVRLPMPYIRDCCSVMECLRSNLFDVLNI